MKDKWLLVLDSNYSSRLNMQRDMDLFGAVRKGQVPGFLRIYNWDVPAVTVGHHRRDFKCYDPVLDIPVIERPTGGGAVLHVDDITYSISTASNSAFGDNIMETYSTISGVFVNAFHKLGIEARQAAGDARFSKICFARSGPMEITLYGKKIMGSAQLRKDGFFLQQGVIPLKTDMNIAARVFGPGYVQGVSSIMNMVKDFDVAAFIGYLIKGFSDIPGVSFTVSPGYRAYYKRAYA